MRWSIGALAFSGARIWYGLIVAPLLALGDQSVAYAVVSWSCAHQTVVAIHLVHLLFLIAAALGAWLAFNAWHAGERTKEQASHGLAAVALAIATLSTLTIAAMWIPAWMISACVA